MQNKTIRVYLNNILCFLNFFEKISPAEKPTEKAITKFTKDNIAIAKVLTSDEYVEEVENPESDVHYLLDHTTIDI